jgi:hypothetical protein
MPKPTQIATRVWELFSDEDFQLSRAHTSILTQSTVHCRLDHSMSPTSVIIGRSNPGSKNVRSACLLVDASMMSEILQTRAILRSSFAEGRHPPTYDIKHNRIELA